MYLQVFDGTRYRTVLTAPGEMSFPQPGLLGTAAWHVDAAKLTAESNGLEDLTGNGRHAVFGAGAAAPKVLPWDGEDYLFTAYNTENKLVRAPTPTLPQTELIVELDYDASPSDPTKNVSLWTSTGYRCGGCSQTTDGRLYLRKDGVTATTAAVPRDRRVKIRIRMTYTDWEVWLDSTSVDSGSWAPVYSDGSSPPGIGGYSSTITDCRWYGASFTMDGDRQLVLDPGQAHEDRMTITNTGSIGGTWNVERPASGYKTAVVDRPLLLFGGSQAAITPSFATPTTSTALVAYRSFGTQAPSHGRPLIRTTGSSGGYMFYQGNGTTQAVAYIYGAGTSSNRLIASTVNGQVVHGLTHDGSVLRVYQGGALVGSVPAAFDSSTVMDTKIASGDDAEFIAAAIWDRALTDAEVARATEELLSGSARSVDDVLPRSVGDLIQSPVPRTDWDDDWQYPVLLNGWTDYGGTHAVARYRRYPGGHCVMQGLVKGGSAVTAVILNLPVGYRPANRTIHSTHTAATTGRLNIEGDGNVFLTTGSTSWASIHAEWFANDWEFG